MRLTPRVTAWAAGFTTLLTGTALLTGVPPAAGDVAGTLRYACTTSFGARNVEVGVAAAVPITGTPGKPIRLGRVTVSVAIPEAAADEILGPDLGAPPGAPAPVAGNVRLAVSITQNGQSTDAAWPAFPVASEPRTDGGKVRLAASGEVPSVLPGAPGDIAWTPGTLSLALSRGPSASPAQPDRPVTCVPEEGGTLAVVAVPGAGTDDDPADPDSTGNPGTSAAPASGVPSCEALESPRFNKDPEIELKKENDERARYDLDDGDPDNPKPGKVQCSALSGFATAAKLAGAAPIAGDSQIQHSMLEAGQVTPQYKYFGGVAMANTAPSTATLLGFGFVPTTATTETAQVATPASKGNRLGNYYNHGWGLYTPTKETNRTLFKTFAEVKVTDIAANGVPIDVGTTCAARPIFVGTGIDQGDDETNRVLITQGGRSNTTVTIPRFSGCRSGDEDLSPLLTASISGPGNHLQIDQGLWCQPIRPEQCASAPTWTVRPGGTITATAEDFTIGGFTAPRGEIKCESLKLKIRFKKGSWQDGFLLGKVTSADFAGCWRYETGKPDGVKQIVKAIRMPGYFRARSFNKDSTVTSLIGGFVIESAEVGDPDCVIRIARKPTAGSGEVPLEITTSLDQNEPQKLTYSGASGSFISPESTCERPGFEPGGRGGIMPGSFVFEPKVTITSP